MKVHLANYQADKLGGGWSFARNLAKGLGDELSNYEDADIYFIAGPTMVSPDDVEQAKRDGKRIVLRIDNIVRNSRNRNTGMSRMKRFTEMADAVVFQSEYALHLLGHQFLDIDGPVILNGCDTDIFHPNGREEALDARYIYSRVNRDETKNWEMARFIFQQQSNDRDGHAFLNIVGEYSPELVEYNFDFYQGERFKYWGPVRDPQIMALIYRNSDYLIYTFWNDACSNTLIEALCCGCTVVDEFGMRFTGGAPDILDKFMEHGADYFTLERMTNDYKEVFNGLLL